MSEVTIMATTVAEGVRKGIQCMMTQGSSCSRSCIKKRQFPIVII